MGSRVWLISGAVHAAVAVAAGAMAAHALRPRLEPRMFEVFETGARYQMYHALALLAVAWLIQQGPSGAGQAAGWCFQIGIVLFSGTLYALALGGPKWLGMITPLGGTLFILGWLALAVAGWGLKRAA